MEKNECYVVLYSDSLENHYKGNLQLAFLETKDELISLLKGLRAIVTKTKQPLSEFAHVFAKGSLYPSEYDMFWQQRNEKRNIRRSVTGDLFVQRTTSRGKVIQKFYAFPEDFDYQLDDWTKASSEIYILDTNESIDGEHLLTHDVDLHWGEREPLIV